MRKMFDICSNVMDERGNRLISIELPAVRTHPEDVRRVLKSGDELELFYRVARGDHQKEGSIDPEHPRIDLRFERGVDPSGVWEIEITGGSPHSPKRRPLWRQGLFVQAAPHRHDDATIETLARRYAPVFVFGSRERYFPVSLATLLTDPAIRSCPDAMKIKTVFGKEMVPVAELGDFMRYNGHSEYLLDYNFLSMRRSVFAALGGDPTNVTIYYSYLEDPDSDRFFINYHQFYAYDTKAGLARMFGVGPHVFDRESMVLVFEADLAPSAMIISGHLEDQEVLLAKLKMWKQGRIAVPFHDPMTLKIGDHPVIAVAEGSHALYPTSGVYHLSLLREIAGYLDPSVMIDELDEDERAPIRPDQIIIPPNCRGALVPQYHLVSLGLDRLTSAIDPHATGYDGYNGYLAFSGYWVDVPGTQNARFPPFTRKESEIVDWVDGAFQWEWADLPARYHDNNRIILGFLRENLEDF